MGDATLFFILLRAVEWGESGRCLAEHTCGFWIFPELFLSLSIADFCHDFTNSSLHHMQQLYYYSCWIATAISSAYSRSCNYLKQQNIWEQWQPVPFFLWLHLQISLPQNHSKTICLPEQENKIPSFKIPSFSPQALSKEFEKPLIRYWGTPSRILQIMLSKDPSNVCTSKNTSIDGCKGSKIIK